MKIVEPLMYKLNQARFNNQTVKAKKHQASADPTVRRVGTTPILNDTNFNFETNQCCLHL